jgi:hypothetical protein
VFHHSIRDHKTLRCTPAEPAALIESTATVSVIVGPIDTRANPPELPRVHPPAAESLAKMRRIWQHAD